MARDNRRVSQDTDIYIQITLKTTLSRSGSKSTSDLVAIRLSRYGKLFPDPDLPSYRIRFFLTLSRFIERKYEPDRNLVGNPDLDVVRRLDLELEDIRIQIRLKILEPDVAILECQLLYRFKAKNSRCTALSVHVCTDDF
jgi:hypothetical protein